MVVIVATKILNNNLSTPSSISPKGELLSRLEDVESWREFVVCVVNY
jgi:hypothetical protein